MKRFIIRLDDASEYMDNEKWSRMVSLLDKYDIKPVFGIIPNNRDEALVSKYKMDPGFWDMVHKWIDKGWIPAMHGYEHRYVTNSGGCNPVNKVSEFAGLPYDEQAKKIKSGWNILTEHGIKADIFFAPSHTFDENTLKAISNETTIRIISDTVAWDIYKEDAMWFIPQQSGRVRSLPFKTVTFCYHPNTMDDTSFQILESFIVKNKEKFRSFDTKSIIRSKRKKTIMDRIISYLYFARRK